MPVQQWRQIEYIQGRNWTCGYCNTLVGSDKAYIYQGPKVWTIYPCPHCDRPTFFDGDRQVPGVAFGASIEKLPKKVASLYEETRNCMSVSAYTLAALGCRKLLMNVAVTQGAQENQSFQSYVDYLYKQAFIPPNAKGWVDHIRGKGNEATHVIDTMSRKDAENLMLLVEMLLKLIFEYPNKAV